MQKVDITIAVVGAIALLTTGLGIVFYDDLAGQDDYTIATGMAAYDEQTSAISATPTVFSFDAPNNTYGSSFEVVVTFTNQNPAITGSVTVTGLLEGLNGATYDCDESAQLSAGSLTLTCEHDGWVELPEDGTYSDDDAKATTPGGAVKLTLTVTGPGSPLPLGPQPTYSASVNGSAMTYSYVAETSDPEAI